MGHISALCYAGDAGQSRNIGDLSNTNTLAITNRNGDGDANHDADTDSDSNAHQNTNPHSNTKCADSDGNRACTNRREPGSIIRHNPDGGGGCQRQCARAPYTRRADCGADSVVNAHCSTGSRQNRLTLQLIGDCA